MNDCDTAELLKRYTAARDEAAFAELVRRYAALVHGTALRICGGRADLAEEASQAVFIRLAQHAPRLLARPQLGGWLHEVACTTTLGLLRAEKRRRQRESTAHALHEADPMTPNDASWQELAPHIDEGLRSLASADREAVVQRFFEGKSARQIAEGLNASPEAVQKRISRALERLRQRFSRRGISLSVAALASALADRSEAGVSEALVQQWTAQAVAVGPLAGGGVISQTVRAVRAEPWAFLAGAAAVAALGWGVPAAMNGASVGPTASPAVAAARVSTAPPRPGQKPRTAAESDAFRAMIEAAREPEPLAGEWKLDAAFLAITPELAHQFILRGEREFDALLARKLFPKLFAQWAEADPATAMDYALSSGVDARLAISYAGFVDSMVWKWIDRDRNAACDWLTQRWGQEEFWRGPSGGMRGQFGAALTTSWIREGKVDEALDFLERLPAGPIRDAALTGVADDGSGQYRWDWPADRVAKLMEALAERAKGPLGSDPLRRSMAVWAKFHPEDAGRWIDGLQDGSARYAAGLAWLSIEYESVKTSEDKEALTISFASKAVTDRAARADRALQAAGPGDTADALKAIVSAWNDPEASFDWLKGKREQLPQSVVDQAMASAAVTLAFKGRLGQYRAFLEKAFRLCGDIPQPALREDAICGLFRRLVDAAPKTAEEFLSRSDWPAERVERLRVLLPQPPLPVQ